MADRKRLVVYGVGAMQNRRTTRTEQYQRKSYRDLRRRLAFNARAARTANEWTQLEAAQRCDMALQQYQRIEAGTDNLTLTTLARLVDGFGVDVVKLLAKIPTKG